MALYWEKPVPLCDHPGIPLMTIDLFHVDTHPFNPI
jgi:hypothetical protein